MGVQRYVSNPKRGDTLPDRRDTVFDIDKTVSVLVLRFWNVAESTVVSSHISQTFHMRNIIRFRLLVVQNMLYLRTELQDETNHIRELLRRSCLRHQNVLKHR